MSVLKDNNYDGNRVKHGNNTSENQTGTSATESYAANRAKKKEAEKEATKKALKTTAKGIATVQGSPAAGQAVELASKTKAGDKILNKGAEALNRIPNMGKTMKKLDDKKVIDTADKAIDIAGANPQSATGSVTGAQAAKSTAESGIAKQGTDATSSSSSVLDKKKPSKPNFLEDDSNSSGNQKPEGIFEGIFSGSIALKAGIGAFVIGIFLILIFLIGLAQGSGIIASYDDALGVSNATGGDTGDIDYESSDPDAQAFFERVNDVKQSFQMQGKSLNAVYISAVFNVLNQHNAKLDYKDMTTAVITDIANAMFSGNSFSEDTFKQNLINNIFPSYLPGKSKDTYEIMAEEVFEYYENYLSLIGAESSNCASLGSCVYEIKGFYIEGKGNITKNLTITDLQVRLMQSGTGNGHDYGGTWGQPLEGEELVPFEKYILGVAYQEIGPDAPDEAIKAQMVAARSYILARPFDMGGWRKIEQESDGTWVIQVAASTQDQVYCDPDKGCSGTDGQWGMVYSGTDHGPGFVREPMPEDHKLRTLANETMGEVLVNDQGNIIYSGYVQTEQNQFTSLANQGLNYKQILLQVYNSGSRNYGATDIKKMNCNTGSGTSCASTGSTGPYAGWKQADPAWGSITIGTSNETIARVGCLVTSVSMLIAKSGVETTVDGEFNPGSFVKKLNETGGFSGALLNWAAVSNAAPNFVFQDKVYVLGQSQEQKLQAIKNLLNQGYYVVAEVKGNTGSHWVAIDEVNGNSVLMMDPAREATDMWAEYDPANTSELAYFKVMS